MLPELTVKSTLLPATKVRLSSTLSDPSKDIWALSPLCATVRSYVVLVSVFVSVELIVPSSSIVILVPAVSAATTFVVSVTSALVSTLVSFALSVGDKPINVECVDVILFLSASVIIAPDPALVTS